ncbi:hypothetical protein L2E82_39270 [Cichorium intybus]|uniref:Uncharacterized protein n=1 Tax=Cichorium intybus TaxID=13427 RepID=A0ACB9AII8_CICIN|nr:hypothetical protein L2E82_39270 [Cichorium intybus]
MNKTWKNIGWTPLCFMTFALYKQTIGLLASPINPNEFYPISTNLPFMDTYSYFFRSSSDYSRQIRRKATFQKRCLTMAKQHRTRFYILRRCVSMLLCWNNHSVSD